MHLHLLHIPCHTLTVQLIEKLPALENRSGSSRVTMETHWKSTVRRGAVSAPLSVRPQFYIFIKRIDLKWAPIQSARYEWHIENVKSLMQL